MHPAACPAGSVRRGDVRGLRPLRPLGHLVPHPLAFLETAKTLGIDRGKVGEHVRTALLRGNKAKSLGVVEPLHGAVQHILCDLVDWGFVRTPRPGGRPRSMQTEPALDNGPPTCTQRGGLARSACSSAGSPAEAAATLSSTSCRVMTSSGSGPAPAAQLATIARQA